MTEKEFKSVKIDNIYVVRPDSEYYEENKNEGRYHTYHYNQNIQNSEIIYEGPHLLPQITYQGEVDAHYIKNSFKNFSFENVDTSTDLASLKVNLKLSNGSTHTMMLSNASVGSLLLEADIEKGLIKSECCFIPHGYGTNNSNSVTVTTMVVKGGRLYKNFLNKLNSQKDLELIKQKDLRTGQQYNIHNKYENTSIFLGFVFEVKAGAMLDSSNKTLSIAKKRVFLSYDDTDNNKDATKIKEYFSGKSKIPSSFLDYYNPIENSPKVEASLKVSTIKDAKNLENLNFNRIFNYNIGMNRTWVYNPVFYFKTKEDAIKFKKEVAPILASSQSTGSVRSSNYGYYNTNVTTRLATKVKEEYKKYFNKKTLNNENLITFVYD